MIMTPSGEDYGPTELIYYKLLLDRTRKALKDRAQIAIPGDIPELVENVYSQEMDQQEIEAYIARMTDQQLQEGEAGQLELKYPDEHTFGFRGTQQNFWDDDEDSWVSAKTRLGEESVRLAIIPPELYERVKKSIDGNTAAKVMPFTATIAKKRAKELLDTADKTDWIIGSGKLNGTYILKAENMAVQSTDDLQAHIGGRTICFGKELGVIIGGDA